MRNACLLLLIIVSLIGCVQNTGDHSPAPLTPSNEIDFWLTKNDETVKLEKQAGSLSFDTSLNQHPSIEVDESITYQSVDGFGFTLTGGSAQTIKSLDESTRQQLLHELFGYGANSISVSYLRLSMGASDLSTAPFTYDDLPIGQADPGLSRFSLADDTIHLIPLLREILQINPAIKIIATPWSPPTWMKDNNSFIGGSLKATNYAVYAQYFVKYIQQMKAMGITIDAITPQNEPLNPGNNPSMLMPAAQQAIFIKDHLGPAFHSANLATKIIIYDHNCDKPEYPLSILNDPKAKHFINGSAFHLYGGDISALSTATEGTPGQSIILH